MERMPVELVLEVLQHAGAILPQDVLDALCEGISDVRGLGLRRRKYRSGPYSAHQELEDLFYGAVKVRAALVLVCRQWYRIFVPFLYSIFYAGSLHPAKVILRTLDAKRDLRTHMKQIIAISADLESWTTDFPDTIDSLVSLCRKVVRLTLLHRDKLTDDAGGPLSGMPLIRRTAHKWNHLRYLALSSITWESFVAYVVAIAGSSKLQSLYIHRVSLQRMDLSEASRYLPPHRDLFSLRELVITDASHACLDLLRFYRFSRLRSFTFQGDMNDSTDLALAAFIGPGFFSLEYLSIPYSALRYQQVILPTGSYTISTQLRTLVLTLSNLDNAVGAPKFPRIPLHKVETLRITGTNQPSLTLPTKHAFRVWLGGLCDKRRMPDLGQIQIGAVLGELKKEEIELVEPFLTRMETLLRVKKVALEVLDTSGTKFVTLSAVLDAACIKIVESDLAPSANSG